MLYITDSHDTLIAMDDHLALWRWSTALQFASALTIAVFFAVFTRDVRTAAVRRWTMAWWANLVAILFVDLFWFLEPAEPVAGLMRCGYVGSKALFLLLLIDGVWVLRHHDRSPVRLRHWGALSLASGIAAAVLLSTIPMLGLVQHLLMAGLLLVGAVLAGGPGQKATRWLGAGFLIRTLLAITVGIAYASVTSPALVTLPWPSSVVQQFLALTSSLDTAAEWLLALGCVLVATTRTRQSLEATNRELLAAQDSLRAMVDHDPLTGLVNRRALPGIMRRVQPTGATVLFLDLRKFKQINDAHGHQVGDAALKRFADELKDSFRPHDHVVRYAGDEFVVVAAGMSREAADTRLDGLRARLALGGPGPLIEFDAGAAALDPDGLPDEAIRTADQLMYDAKEFAHGRAPRGVLVAR